MTLTNKILTAVAMLSCVSLAMADTASVEANLKKLYPNTKFSAVKETPLTGIYEVTMGNNIAYVQESGRHFIFGALYDMQSKKDLTAISKAAATKTAYADLPFKNAIKVVKGNGGKGKREFAIFSDPDCPFCKRLEETMSGMTDYTAYIFLYPIDSLHPEASTKAERIWCSANPETAWHNYMLLAKEPAVKTCKNPVAENKTLGNRMDMYGTPSMVHKDGRRTAGAMSRANLEAWLNGEQ